MQDVFCPVLCLLILFCQILRLLLKLCSYLSVYLPYLFIFNLFTSLYFRYISWDSILIGLVFQIWEFIIIVTLLVFIWNKSNCLCFLCFLFLRILSCALNLFSAIVFLFAFFLFFWFVACYVHVLVAGIYRSYFKIPFRLHWKIWKGLYFLNQ